MPKYKKRRLKVLAAKTPQQRCGNCAPYAFSGLDRRFGKRDLPKRRGKDEPNTEAVSLFFLFL
jgi:hypothetical protein